MLNLPLDKMSRTEKVLAMEALWQDLTRDVAHQISPEWHKDTLAETERRVASGEEQAIDWEEANKQLRQRFE